MVPCHAMPCHACGIRLGAIELKPKPIAIYVAPLAVVVVVATAAAAVVV